MRIWPIALWFAAIAVSPVQQPRDGHPPPTTGAGSIAGTMVMADPLATPVRRGVVRLTSPALAVDAVYALTDENGAFTFSALPPGDYSVTGERPGFLPSSFGAKHAAGPGTPIALAAGQRVGDARVQLIRGSVITGTILDKLGRPAPGLTVEAQRYGLTPDTGEHLPRQVEIGTGSAISDADGRYRLFGLEPGEYVVSAWPGALGPEASTRQITDADLAWATLLLNTPPGNALPPDRRDKKAAAVSGVGDAPLYYPSANSIADATRISLGVADERTGIDFSMRPVGTSAIGGAISGPYSTVSGRGTVVIIDHASAFQAKARWDDQGRFSIYGVPPGQYTLIATPELGAFRASVDVYADGLVLLPVSLSPNATVRGRLVFDGIDAPDPLLARVLLAPATRMDATYRTPLPRKDGTFLMPGVPAGTYRLSATMPQNMQPGWRARSAMLGDVDLFDTPLVVKSLDNITDIVITFVNTRSEISGTMTAPGGTPAVDYTVLAFAADPGLRGPQSRRTQWVRPNTQGRFSIRDLPAGDYIIAAVSDIEPGQWNDAAFLAELAPYGVKVMLADGEKKVQNIKIGGGL
jgi:hypothetical protein